MDEYSEDDQNQQQTNKDSQPLDSGSDVSRFAEVKARAMQELLAIMPQASEFSAEKRFDIYMSAIRTSSNVESAESALDAALSIEDQDLRANALSELIDEVEYVEARGA